MLGVMQDMSLGLLVLSGLVGLMAGVVKGIVGFAMPMVTISGLSTFLAPEIALGGLILPTLVTNGMQALRQGIPAAMQSIRRFRYFLVTGGIMLLIAAQFVAQVPAAWFLLAIGVPVSGFAALQLLGRDLPLPRVQTRRADMAVGAFAGTIGGFSGIWGPPTVTYLTAIGTEKREQMRVQGVIYGLGAVLLTVAHLGSGIFNAQTAPLSAALVPPAVLGMWIGGRIQDRFDQVMFKRVTLFVLLIAGLNLVRRAVM